MIPRSSLTTLLSRRAAFSSISIKFKYSIFSLSRESRKTLKSVTATSKKQFYYKYTMQFKYPDARRDDSVVDDYFGTPIRDPYRWLEDPDAEETKRFVDKQNELTQPYLEDYPYRSAINDRLKKLWDYPRYGCPSREGNRYFFSKNSGLQNQSVLYKQERLDSEPEVFLDPNLLSDDGTVALTSKTFSEDGSILAFGLSSSGSDWNTIQFKNVATGLDYPEILKKVKFASIAWTHDNKGIFYGMYPDQSDKSDGSETECIEFQKIYYHRIGTPQEEDVLVVEFPDEPKLRFGFDVTQCGRYLIVCPMKGCRDNLVYFSDLENINYKIEGPIPLTQVVFKLESDYKYVTNQGSKCIFRTNKNAPNYRLIEIDLNSPQEENWKTIIEEDSNDVLDWAAGVNKDKLILCYIQHVKNVLQYRDLDGKLLHQFPIEVGTIYGFTGSEKYSEIFFQFTGFLTPGVIYRCDLNDSPITMTVQQEVKPDGFDRENYLTKQVFYKSKDGTKVPMFIVHKKDLKINAENPCLLYGYGGFNVSIQPVFSISRLVFIQHFNGVLAIPNIRGGGEYGEKWHNGGRFGNKQNVFDDFQSAAESLIELKYTKPALLAIQGGSNGGLLVAACANQRPDLFGAVICQVGVLDMLRFHKFTIGHAWTTDYGCSDEKDNFDFLIKYSPLHNIRVPPSDIQYPPMLLMTADHDDRVVPLHSVKFIAELQHTMKDVPKQKNPLLIRIETKAGHGGGKPISKVIEEVTDVLTFIGKSLNLKFL